MIKHVWSLLARQSIVDPDTNSLTIVEVLENLRIDIQLQDNPFMDKYDREQINAFPINFEVVSTYYREKKGIAKTASSELEVYDPTDKLLANFANLIEFKPEHDRMRMRAKFDSLGVTKSGVYNFKVYLKQSENGKRELVLTIPLNVSVYVDGEEVV